VRRLAPTRASKRGTPKSRYFTAVNSPSVKTAADKDKLVAYCNMH